MGMKALAEGAEAVVYETTLGGMPALMKRRIRKEYRVREMDTKIRTLRSRNEARIIATASKAGINSPKLLLFDGYDIYMTAIKGEKLAGSKASVEVFRKVGEMLGMLHSAGIAHGDYTPANIILGKDRPYIIDFGLSEITDSVEEKAFDLLLMKRSVQKGSYLAFLNGYKARCKQADETLDRLEVIERRGRYQTRTLS
jgi:N6-L-threonylcarbamoyladenine synthase/protein kinase Bud32